MIRGQQIRAATAFLLGCGVLLGLAKHNAQAGAIQEPVALSAEKAGSWNLLGAAVTGEAVLAARKKLFGIPDYEDWRTSVSSIKQVDVNGDGKIDIVAGINLKTSQDPVEFITIVSSGEGYVVQLFSAEHLSVEKAFLDIKGDGRYELVLKSLLSDNVPLNEATYWADIYSWDNGKYRMNSKGFIESYYMRQYLEYVSSKINRATQLLAMPEVGDTARAKTSKIALGILQDCRTALKRIVELGH